MARALAPHALTNATATIEVTFDRIVELLRPHDLELAERYRAEGERLARAIATRTPVPNDPEAVAARAEALLHVGDVARAIAAWQSVAEKTSENIPCADSASAARRHHGAAAA